MFRCEQRDELYILCFEQNIDRWLAREVAAGVICNETDAFASTFFEIVFLEDFDAVEDRRVLRNNS